MSQTDEMSIIVGKPTVIYSQESQAPLGHPSTPTKLEATEAIPKHLKAVVDSSENTSFCHSQQPSNASHSHFMTDPYRPPHLSQARLSTSSLTDQQDSSFPPGRNTNQVPQAVLTAGWEALFHEPPGPPYKLDHQNQSYETNSSEFCYEYSSHPGQRAAAQCQERFNISDRENWSGGRLAYGQQAVTDRWAEYMSYDFLADHSK